ncbi:hypothetical protein LIER_13715 [Lithospermum erythrorhizon]|uniref:Uncharacterized protein n=1 Tax=Lithospermum erythrorhizon TaxID=34254 RepID=A0AAV3PXZ0_LITER
MKSSRLRAIVSRRSVREHEHHVAILVMETLKLPLQQLTYVDLRRSDQEVPIYTKCSKLVMLISSNPRIRVTRENRIAEEGRIEEGKKKKIRRGKECRNRRTKL